MRAGFVSDVSMGDSYQSRNNSCSASPWVREQAGLTCLEESRGVFNVVSLVELLAFLLHEALSCLEHQLLHQHIIRIVFRKTLTMCMHIDRHAQNIPVMLPQAFDST
jgi:hypothetical protein